MQRPTFKKLIFTIGATLFALLLLGSLALVLMFDPWAEGRLKNKIIEQLAKNKNLSAKIEATELYWFPPRLRVLNFELKARQQGTETLRAIFPSLEFSYQHFMFWQRQLQIELKAPKLKLYLNVAKFDPEVFIVQEDAAEVERKARQDPEAEERAQAKKDFIQVKINNLSLADAYIGLNYIFKPDEKNKNKNLGLNLERLSLDVYNLYVTDSVCTIYPSSFKLKATVFGEGQLLVDGLFTTTYKGLMYDINGDLKKLPLTKINSLLREAADFDVSKGNFNMAFEVSREGNVIDGYVKPAIEQLDVSQTEDFEQSLWQGIYEAGLGIAAEVLEYQPKDRQAAKIPFHKVIDNTDVDYSTTIESIFTNVFAGPLSPTRDNSIRLKDL